MSETRTKQADSERDEATLLPPVNVVEDSGGITLTADMAGVPKDRLVVQIDADSLTIEGEVHLDVPQGMEASHAEVPVPRYRRTFALSKELDTEKVAAEYLQGVLTLRIPKAEHAQPRKVAIKVS
jgi:HSP20 family molecular chaperone IbpA